MQMTPNNHTVDIVIPNWNGKDMLAACLKTLKQQSCRDFRVIVVDNGSTDGSADLVTCQYPEFTLIRLDHNTGFSAAVNAGIHASEADWLFLLNNDMEVDVDCVEQLLRSIRQFPDYDFFALKMLSFHNRDIIDGAGDSVLRGGVGYRLGTMEADSARYMVNRETFGACAGAGVYARKLFQRAGLFDPDFFAYLEDVDLNMRARKKGFRCMFLASCKVFHIGSATTGSKINPMTIRLSTCNNFAVIIKNYPVDVLLRFLPAILIYQAIWALFCIKKKMFGPYVQGLVESLQSAGRNFEKRRALKNESLEWSGNSREFVSLVKAAENDTIQSIMMRRETQGKSNTVFRLYCKFFL